MFRTKTICTYELVDIKLYVSYQNIKFRSYQFVECNLYIRIGSYRIVCFLQTYQLVVYKLYMAFLQTKYELVLSPFSRLESFLQKQESRRRIKLKLGASVRMRCDRHKCRIKLGMKRAKRVRR